MNRITCGGRAALGAALACVVLVSSRALAHTSVIVHEPDGGVLNPSGSGPVRVANQAGGSGWSATAPPMIVPAGVALAARSGVPCPLPLWVTSLLMLTGLAGSQLCRAARPRDRGRCRTDATPGLSAGHGRPIVRGSTGMVFVVLVLAASAPSVAASAVTVADTTFDGRANAPFGEFNSVGVDLSLAENVSSSGSVTAGTVTSSWISQARADERGPFAYASMDISTEIAGPGAGGAEAIDGSLIEYSLAV